MQRLRGEWPRARALAGQGWSRGPDPEAPHPQLMLHQPAHGHAGQAECILGWVVMSPGGTSASTKRRGAAQGCLGERALLLLRPVAQGPLDQYPESPASRSRGPWWGPVQPVDGSVPQPLASAAFLSEGSEDPPGVASRPTQLLSGLCGFRALGVQGSGEDLCLTLSPVPSVMGRPSGPMLGRIKAQVGGTLVGTRRVLRSQGVFAEWQDPEFMRDVEAATGVDLGSSRARGRGRGRRRRHPGLTDLKQRADTARTRIAKKVFAK